MKKSRDIEFEEKGIYWEQILSRWQASGLSQIESGTLYSLIKG
jgi:hypothetical protein